MSEDMPIPVDPRDAEIAELKTKLAAIDDLMRKVQHRLNEPARGGIHTGSTLAGGNVDHLARDEGRIHVTDQY